MSAEVAAVRVHSAAQARRRSFGHIAAAHSTLILVCLLVLLPCYFLFLGSFKSVPEFFSSPFGLPRSWSFVNYREAWTRSGLGTAFLNSVLVTGGSVLISTGLAALASYAIARLRFRGATLVQLLFVSGLLIPAQLIIIAVFIEMRELGLLGTIWPLIILYSTFALPLGVLFLIGFFRAIPPQLTEAAAIDGASVWRQFVDIALPLARAPIFTVAILNGVWIWNDFFLPLIFSTSSDIRTVPVAILNFQGEYTTDYGLLFAAVVMSVIPVIVVYVLMTRRFIAGVTAGSLKG